ncbi:MFS transporter [Paucibacter sp. Y2R2-4]|uniref:MFS transporter n=1 Tax=Paucibacter sp. Y2R2-4 TaxID=2893553 RepID=UPI0021E4654C|nr:MFS transporter [Paucibacter sp. Y2R2-4]MCV2352097.1 MFS transporter [Paucibacter sp. Y2R2-4]
MKPAPDLSAITVRHPQWVLVAVCALALMSTIGVSMPYPILAPIFVGGPVDGFTHFAGLDPKFLMGLALAANPLGILLGSLFIGPLSDRQGRRQVLGLTLSATLLGHALTAYALSERDYLLFIFARWVTGLTESNVAVARALLADMHAQIDRTRAFAWLNACLYMGWLLGPLVGGLTLPLGEAVPFVLAGLAMLPCLMVLMLWVPAGQPPLVDGSQPKRGFWSALGEQQVLGLLRRDRLLATLFALQLFYCLGVNALYEFAPLWMLENLGFGSVGIAWVTAAQCAAMTTASVIAGKLRQSRRPLRRAGLLALCAALGLSALAVLPGQLGLAAIIGLGLPLALYNAVLPAWVSERFADYGQGRVMGLLSTIFCLANVLMALAGGLISMLSTRWIMGLGGLTCVIAALALLRLANQEAGRPDEGSKP